MSLEFIENSAELRQCLERKNVILVTLNYQHDPDFTETFIRYIQKIDDSDKILFAITSLKVRKEFKEPPQVAPQLELFVDRELLEKAQGRFGLLEKVNEFVIRINACLPLKTDLIQNLPYSIFGSAATEFKDGIIVTGGYDGKANNFTQFIDNKTLKWQISPPMRIARFGHTLSRSNDTLFAIGGASNKHCVSDVEMLSPDRARWQIVGKLAIERTKHTTICLNDKRLLVIGGYAKPGLNKKYAVEVFDILTQKTTPLASGLGYRVGHTATLLSRNRILVVGGIDLESFENPYNQALKSVVLYDIDQEKTYNLGNLNSERAFHTSTLDKSGKYLIIAGGFNKHKAVPSIEVFCLSSGRVIKTVNLQFPRSNHSALLTKEGSILLLGGVNGHQVLSVIECYQFERESTQIIGFMQYPRYGFSVARLDGENYLILGGAYEGKVSSAVERISLSAMLDINDC